MRVSEVLEENKDEKLILAIRLLRVLVGNMA